MKKRLTLVTLKHCKFFFVSLGKGKGHQMKNEIDIAELQKILDERRDVIVENLQKLRKQLEDEQIDRFYRFGSDVRKRDSRRSAINSLSSFSRT